MIFKQAIAEIKELIGNREIEDFVDSASDDR
jgi:hypothetical protein